MKFTSGFLFFLLISCSYTKKQTSFVENNLNKIINADHRIDKNKKRNQYRNPVETFKFFGLEPDMAVVEISPGGGWYTEILAPYLKNEGQVYLAIFSPNTKREFYQQLNKTLKNKIESMPEVYGEPIYTQFEAPNSIGPIANSDNSIDMVLTFRNIHNWMKQGVLEESLAEFHRVLKKGGVLGIVEHREKMTRKQDPKALSGYVRQDYMIKKAEDAGFKLVATSEINANPKDDSLYPEGVWTLPPSLRLGEKDREKYLSIGESDRMTLKFIKK